MKRLVPLALLLLLATPTAQATSYRVHTAAQDTKALALITERLKTDIDRVPSDHEWPGILLTDPSAEPRWRGPYLDRMPKDPWGRAYLYRPREGEIRIYSAGVNGADDGGNSDDVTSWAGFSADIYFPHAKRDAALALLALLAAVSVVIGAATLFVRWLWRTAHSAHPSVPADVPASPSRRQGRG